MVNKQAFASWLGIIILIVHIVVVAYLFLIFQPNVDKVVAAGEIVLPITTAYALTVVSWFINNGGIITTTEEIGWYLVIVSVLVVGSFLIGLPAGMWLYTNNLLLGAKGLNTYYTVLESAFGGMFVLIFNFMFEKQT